MGNTIPSQSQQEMVVIKMPILDFYIPRNQFYINVPGVSVNEDDKSFTSLSDTSFKVLNKNNTPIYFKGITLASIKFRGEIGIPSRFIQFLQEEVEVEDGYVIYSYALYFRRAKIGLLKLRTNDKYANSNNSLIYPFQSVEFNASYMVENVNHLHLQYFGRSQVRPNKRVGTIDIGLKVTCFTDKTLIKETSDIITICVNAVNTGYIAVAVQPSVPPVYLPETFNQSFNNNLGTSQ